MAITNFESAQSLFVGQGDLIIFDPIDDYSTATLASLVNPKSLGQVVEDSSSWTGDDVSVDEIRDEQGDIITASVGAGTLAYEFDLASVSSDMIEKFLKGTKFQSANVESVFGSASGTSVSAVGFGTQLPVITAPIAWLNDEKKSMLLFPKAKLTANFANSDKLMRIHVSVLAENVDNTSLKTGMMFYSNTAAA